MKDEGWRLFACLCIGAFLPLVVLLFRSSGDTLPLDFFYYPALALLEAEMEEVIFRSCKHHRPSFTRLVLVFSLI